MDKNEFKLVPLPKPLVIDAVRCRLRQDLDYEPHRPARYISDSELRLILNILDASREFVRQHDPTEFDVSRGCGAESGQHVSRVKLVEAVKAELDGLSYEQKTEKQKHIRKNDAKATNTGNVQGG